MTISAQRPRGQDSGSRGRGRAGNARPAGMGVADKIGSIVEGKRADLIVVDRDIFEVSLEDLAETDVLSTMVNGRIVFDQASTQEPPEALGPEKVM